MATLNDGFATTVAFNADPSILFYEKSVSPPSLTVEGAIDITTMRNTAWRTRVPKTLKSLGDMSLTVSYDSGAYADIIANLLGVNDQITVTFSDAATLVFYGWLDSFTPGASVEGEQPEADVTIIASNLSGTTETAPV
jgi:hypothetical protein